jgi:hypothetical protein
MEESEEGESDDDSDSDYQPPSRKARKSNSTRQSTASMSQTRADAAVKGRLRTNTAATDRADDDVRGRGLSRQSIMRQQQANLSVSPTLEVVGKPRSKGDALRTAAKSKNKIKASSQPQAASGGDLPNGAVRAKAKYTYKPSMKSGLPLKKHQVVSIDVTVTPLNSGDWLFAKNSENGKSGYVPANYLKFIKS